MKKTILSTVIAVVGLLSAQAQTEFRHFTFDEAKTAAKAEGKLIFVDFYTQWCGPCKRMAATVFPQKEIGDYLNPNYVCLKLDAEAEGAELAKTVGVKAYPTFMVFDADGNELGSFAGMKQGQEFITAVEMCKNPDLTPERIQARYSAGERTPELVRAYAINIVESSRDYMAAMKQAGGVIDEYFASLTDQQKFDPANHFLYDTYTTGFTSPRIQYVINNRAKFDASKKDAIDKIVKDQHEYEAQRYFTTNSITDQASREEFAKFKKSAEKLGFATEYANQLIFAEIHGNTDLKGYVTYCDKNFKKLSEKEQGQLLATLGRVFEPSTPEEVKTVTGFARKHLANLPADYLIWAAHAINELESPNKH